jgi:hypothetical protein
MLISLLLASGGNIMGANTIIANTIRVLAGANINGDTLIGGNANVDGNLILSSASKLKIAGGNVGQYIRTDGNGNITWADTTITTVAGANVTGWVANANIANIANTANTANVANLANTSNVANLANTANTVAGANVTGWVANANVANTATKASTVTSTAQPNITSVGNLSTLVVSGNTIVGNITVSGTLNVANFTQSPNLVIANTTMTLASNTSTAADANGAGLVVGNSNVANMIYNSNSNTWNYNIGIVAPSFSGNGAALTTITGINVTGSVPNATRSVYATQIESNSNITITANANATAGYILMSANGQSNIISITSNGTSATTSFANNITISGNTVVTSNITVGNAAIGNLVTSNYANISTELNVSGNIAATGANIFLGTIANLHITGGSNGQYIRTDGTGNLSFVQPIFTALANGNSNVTVVANSNVNMYVSGNTTAVLSVGTNGIVVSSNIVASGNISANYFNGLVQANRVVGSVTSALTTFHVNGSDVDGQVSSALLADTSNTANFAVTVDRINVSTDPTGTAGIQGQISLDVANSKIWVCTTTGNASGGTSPLSVWKSAALS